MNSARWSTGLFVLWLAIVSPGEARAACASPLPSGSLHELDGRIDSDPAGVLRDARERLGRLHGTDALQEAELYALIADAESLSDNDAQVRVAVAKGRVQLEKLPDSDAQRAIRLRLDLTAADSPSDMTDMAASIEQLTRIEQSLPPGSLDRACLLIVRSRLNMQMGKDEEATTDGLTAHRLATALGAREAAADAAHQLAFALLRAGLLDDADAMVAEANAYYRQTAQGARLSNGLYIQADIRMRMRDYDRALALNAEVRGLNQQEHRLIDVAFDDSQRCAILLALHRLESARQSCVAAESVIAAAGRPDIQAGIEADLARIDLERGQPAAAIARLDKVLSAGADKVSPKTLPKIFKYRAEALGAVGRYREALRDLREAVQLTEATDEAGHGIAAARLKERITADTAREEKSSLEARMRLVRQEAESRAKQSRLQLALAAATAMLLTALAYFLWRRFRQEHALRTAAQTLESQAHVISTMRDGVLLVDQSGQIRYANPAATRLLARPLGELLGSGVERLGIATRHLGVDGTATQDHGMVGGRELQWMGADNKPLSLLFTCSQVTLLDDPFTICILQDVTELRRLERRLFSAASDERHSIGKGILEGLSQELAGLSQLLKGVTGRSDSDDAKLEYVRNLANDLIEDSQAFAHGLSPVQIESGSLTAALSRLAQEQALASGVRIDCRSSMGDLHLGSWQADHLFRIAKRCVALALRDSSGGAIDMNLHVAGSALTLAVTANCVARVAAMEFDGHDWGTISYLTKVIGGTAHVESAPQGALCRVVSVPLAGLMTRDPDHRVPLPHAPVVT